jgi:prophage antirepressor-like protein
VFNFSGHDVRVVMRDGEPWFAAADVCGVLAIKNFRDSVRHLDADERGVVSTDTPARNQHGVIPGQFEQLQVVSESGLYALVLRSRKPEARKFTKWVTSEVLPAIRKTGVYVGRPFAVNPGDVLTQEEQNTLRLMLKTAAERQPKEKQAALMVQGWSKLKAHFGVPYREIPRHEFSEAVSIIARHTAEWELVDEPPKAGTINEMVADWVRQIETPNGAPAMLFLPLVEAVQRKMGKAPAIDLTDAAWMKQARGAADEYLENYRAAVKAGKTRLDMPELSPELMHSLIAEAVMRQRMLVSFDYSTGRMCASLVPGDASVVSFSKDNYFDIAQKVPMDRLPEMLAELNKRVACHLGAFSKYLGRDRGTSGTVVLAA